MNIEDIINHIRNLTIEERREFMEKIMCELFCFDKIAMDNYIEAPYAFYRFKKQKLELSELKEIVDKLKNKISEAMLYEVVSKLSKLYSYDDLKTGSVGIVLLAGKYGERVNWHYLGLRSMLNQY